MSSCEREGSVSDGEKSTGDESQPAAKDPCIRTDGRFERPFTLALAELTCDEPHRVSPPAALVPWVLAEARRPYAEASPLSAEGFEDADCPFEVGPI